MHGCNYLHQRVRGICELVGCPSSDVVTIKISYGED